MASSRPLALALATFVAGLAAGWFLWHGDRAAPDEAWTTKKKSSALEPPALRAGSTAPEPPTDVPTPTDATPKDTRVADPTPVAYPTLDVRVLDAEGRPVHAALVYGLPAGSRGTDDKHAVVRGWTDGESGQARLSFPAAHVYDVGAISGVRHVLATDVAVPARSPVVLRLPATASVEISADEATTAAIVAHEPMASTLRFESTGEGQLFEFPGRSEGLKAWVAVSPTTRSVALVEGRPYRAEFAGDDEGLVLAVDPAKVVPPATLRVSVAGRTVNVDLVVSPQLVPPTRLRLALDFRGGDRAIGSEEWVLDPNEPTGSVGTTLTVPAGVDTIRWEGTGVAPGAASVVTDPEGRTVAKGTVSVTGTLPVTPDPPARRPVDIEGPPGEIAKLEGIVARSGEDDWDLAWLTWDRERGRGVAAVLVAPTGPLVVYGDPRDDGSFERRYVSAPAADGAPLRLVRGGFAVVVPEGLPPPSAWMRIVRADGHPLLARDEFAVGPVGVAAGDIVGPLEPGTIRFRVFLAGVEVGEASVTIRPDAYAPLVVRLSTERRKR